MTHYGTPAETLARHSWYDMVVGRPCKRYSCKTLLLDALTQHSCYDALLRHTWCDTFPGHLRDLCSTGSHDLSPTHPNSFLQLAPIPFFRLRQALFCQWSCDLAVSGCRGFSCVTGQGHHGGHAS